MLENDNPISYMIDDNETVLYSGKPNKKCFIFESIFNGLLIFALIWLTFDSFFIINAIQTFDIMLMGFLAFHLLPVWLYLGNIIFMFLRYKNTHYVITDHAVYISSGIFTNNVKTKTFQEVNRINLHRGIFDKKLNVGDVVISTNEYTSKGKLVTMDINSISEYAEVYQLIKKLQKDIYSDTMFPNEYRPQGNHGYNTKYKG